MASSDSQRPCRARSAIRPCLCSGRRRRLPLHVAGFVKAAVLQRRDVIEVQQGKDRRIPSSSMYMVPQVGEMKFGRERVRDEPMCPFIEVA